MNLANRKFKDNRTGETHKVLDSFENIAVFENKQKIDVRRLMDPNYFTEVIDPSSFFSNQGAYNILAEKIKNIPSDNLLDNFTDNNPITESYSDNTYKPTINDSAIIEVDEDYEKAELARKYGVVDNRQATVKQQEAFAKLLGDEEELPAPPPQPTYQVPRDEPVQRIEVNRDGDGAPVQKPVAKAEDPINVMFRNAKKVVEFTLDLKLTNKIPRLDFIEMMEDSYEKSIIDFLAGEIANELINDPINLKFKISEKIKEMVYKKPAPKKRPVKKKPTQRKTTVVDKLKEDVDQIVKPKRTIKKETTV
jgi:hypothetical protein